MPRQRQAARRGGYVTNMPPTIPIREAHEPGWSTTQQVDHVPIPTPQQLRYNMVGL